MFFKSFSQLETSVRPHNFGPRYPCLALISSILRTEDDKTEYKIYYM